MTCLWKASLEYSRLAFFIVLTLLFPVLLQVISVPVQAKDSFNAEDRYTQARRLTQSLTPLGAERVGNGKDIPDWEHRDLSVSLSDELLAEKPIRIITAENWREHLAWLTLGQQQLFRKYPDVFQMQVYPTRRTASAPQSVYDNTYRNQIRSELNRHSRAMEFALGGIPFPIPNKGIELVWNHMARWKAHYGVERDRVRVLEVLVSGNERQERSLITRRLPLFYPEVDRRPNQVEAIYRQSWLSPATESNFNMVIGVDSVSGGRVEALTSSEVRSIARAENNSVSWPEDFPLQEDRDMFSGDPYMYRWQLLGHREILAPYNNQKLLNADNRMDLLGAQLPNSSLIRYEKRRVWVLEGTLRRGKNHVYRKRVLYIDEDSWAILLADIYDQQGRFWRMNMAVNAIIDDYHGLIGLAEIHQDFVRQFYFASLVMD